MKKTKILAINSLFCALCVVIMAMASIIETLDISLAVIAGVIVAVSETEFGSRWAWLVFAVSGILSILLPQKSVGLFFILIAGWYPIIQPKLNLLKPVISYTVKFLIVNAATLIAILVSKLFFKDNLASYIIAALFVLSNITFYLYDKVLTRLILWYIVKLRSRLGFGKK